MPRGKRSKAATKGLKPKKISSAQRRARKVNIEVARRAKKKSGRRKLSSSEYNSMLTRASNAAERIQSIKKGTFKNTTGASTKTVLGNARWTINSLMKDMNRADKKFFSGFLK
jgi:hypothetical protein